MLVFSTQTKPLFTLSRRFVQIRPGPWHHKTQANVDMLASIGPLPQATSSSHMRRYDAQLQSWPPLAS